MIKNVARPFATFKMVAVELDETSNGGLLPNTARSTPNKIEIGPRRANKTPRGLSRMKGSEAPKALNAHKESTAPAHK